MVSKSYIKTLIARDKPMPMGRYVWQSKGLKNDPPADTCGNCDKPVAADVFSFCPYCGQRIDPENYKL